MPQPAIKEKTETVTKTQLARPWKVVVHNDPITLMSYVVMVFQKLFGYAYHKAHGLMIEVHRSGRAIVWTGAHEQAEIYVQKLHGHQLLASLEQADA